MDGFETAEQAAKRLGFNYAVFTQKCKREEVPGATKWLDRWMIPSDVTREQVEGRRGRPKKEESDA